MGKLDELTIKEAKELSQFVRGGTMGGGKSHSLVIGEKYLVRTVTHYYTGVLKEITESDLVLGEAAWIASTGRFSDALETGKLDEVEPFPDIVIISRDGLIDCSPWKHDLPREQK